MVSSFFEFNVATSALFTARANLQVTNHNVANAEIVGYTRQYAESRATAPLSFYNGKGMVGTGSEVYGIGQMRDFYLDKKFWSERGVLGEHSAKFSQLSVTQAIFNPLSDTSLNDAFNNFFAKLQSLSESAGDATYRTNAIQAGENIVSYVNLAAQSLKKQQSDINSELRITVETINSIGEQIKSLNRQIKTYELDGSQANDLRDARARLVDQLSLYVNVEVNETEMNKDFAAGKYPEPEDRGRSDKRFSVMINGTEFINNFDITPLTIKERPIGQKSNPMDVEGLYDIYYGNGNKFDMYSPTLKGELKGLIDMRDGNNGTTMRRDNNGNIIKTLELSNTNFKGIPHYMKRLNDLVSIFARAVNEGKDKSGAAIPGVIGHIDGYDANLNTGNLFFSWDKGITKIDKQNLPQYNITVDYKTTKDIKLNTNESATLNMIKTLTTQTPVPVNTTLVRDIIVKAGSQVNSVTLTADTIFKAGSVIDNTSILEPGSQFQFMNVTINPGDTIPAGTEILDGSEIKSMDYIYERLVNVDTFMMNSGMAKDPGLVASSSTATGGQSNNEVIKGFFKIKDYTSLFKEGKLADYITGMTGELGIDTKQAEKFSKNYTDVTTVIDNQRKSISGVDINEEMVNMMKFQQQYVAATKLINIIDSIYDTTINRMGSW